MDFPRRRKDTVTRANIERAMKDNPILESAEDVAAFFCGVGGQGQSRAEPRHLERCRRLLDRYSERAA
jgi:hypothetical protein